MTEAQQAALDLVEQHGSIKAAARATGRNVRGLQRAINRAKAAQARQGVSPEFQLNRPAPDFLKLKGLSDMRKNADGLPVWYKFSEDRERVAEMMREAVEAMREEIPAAEPIPAPVTVADSDLLNLYVLTDFHLGMLAWAEETGDDWDMRIAEDTLMAWFRYAIAHAPPAQTAYFAQIGDLLHFDGLEAVTPASGHILDADTRFAKLVRVAIRCLRRAIKMMLGKYQTVVVLMADANHDPSGSVWLREFFAALYEDEPRVVVDQNCDTYYCYEHGKTCLFFHHGHKRKPGDISKVFAGKYPEAFGRTRYRYAHMGHLHHIDVKEDQLMVVEQHRTLAGKDAYASRGGHLSERSSPVITYCKREGEVSRLTVTPNLAKRAA
ncbi:MAG: winged helix-turn-helix domain-containing protein [Spiribacter salinus]|uniref:Winged helix-turn-helix domain-containing protein n=1 Tax=Spiribacter salinus TaxID=1335746 RepID=A0A540VH22_9GAMM|nr:MAG: winged helix-turn-helix domain-containing protein [Spiribacter salinus]